MEEELMLAAALMAGAMQSSAAAPFAMELWLKLGRPASVPAPGTPEEAAFHALCLMHGYDERLDRETALGASLLREAARRGCVQACEYLACPALALLDQESSPGSIERYARQAAELGRPEALVDIFTQEYIHRGQEGRGNLMEAELRHLAKANPETSWYVATRLMMIRHPQTITWVRRAIAEGSARAHHEMGAWLLAGNQVEEGLASLRAGADRGISRCAVGLLIAMGIYPEHYLEIKLHAARYAELAVSDGNPDGIPFYVDAKADRGRPEDIREAVLALTIQCSCELPETVDDPYDGEDMARTVYPRRKGKAPLAPAWNWLFDRLATDPRKSTLAIYGDLWCEMVFSPRELKKDWVYLG
jgi:hypothetical protein